MKNSVDQLQGAPSVCQIGGFQQWIIESWKVRGVEFVQISKAPSTYPSVGMRSLDEKKLGMTLIFNFAYPLSIARVYSANATDTVAVRETKPLRISRRTSTRAIP
jgi:hypothetical protein